MILNRQGAKVAGKGVPRRSVPGVLAADFFLLAIPGKTP
jgi:hypothetical protein